MKIIYEDQEIIVCHKPAKFATQTARVGEKDMVSELKNYLHQQTGREPYVGLVHRLDQGVEGILVFAKTPAAAAGLSRQVTEHIMKKYYYAAAAGQSGKQQGTWIDYLKKDPKGNRSVVVKQGTQDAKRAELHYQCMNSDPLNARHLFRVELITGRHHQIRAQFSYHGLPLINDTKYGYQGERENTGAIALCAYRLSFKHPTTGKELSFEIRPTSAVICTMLV